MSLQDVRDRIARACDSCGRDQATVTLVAVSKTVSVDDIQRVYDQRHRVFGENRLQEALPKITALPSDIEWHFVGRLQSNKAKAVAEAFGVIHTLENERQLAGIGKASRLIDGLIELNLGREVQKGGICQNPLTKP